MCVRRGLSLVDVVVGVAVFVVLSLLALVLYPAFYMARVPPAQLKDSTQVRGIHQAMLMWAQNNNDVYPLPSLIDVDNATVAEEGEAKDTTANIMSLLVANGSITPEILVSPLEVNRNIRVYERYEFESPRRAVRPREAHWDPGLSADFTVEGGGHVSYAHLLPGGERRARWASTYGPAEAILGARGPEITDAGQQADGTVRPVLANPRTLTFRFVQPRDSWQGNVGFNDNHVEFVQGLTVGMYRDAGGRAWPDLLHYDEPDDPAELNHYLGIFIRAGERREDFQGIWD